MAVRLRLLLPLLFVPVLATCKAPVARGPARAAPPFINPLPIPDAPLPRISLPYNEPSAIRLLLSDDDLAGAICRDGTGMLPSTGTLFGHVRANEPATGDLIPAPAALASGSCQQVHGAMREPLTAMIDTARQEAPDVGRAIMAISCFRSIERQAALFCDRGRVAQRGYAGQARWIAPPGYSEHASGLSIDFGSRSEAQCNLRPCFARTGVGRWLAENAGRFGFELSFPEGNAQGVAHEPWHYRYVSGSAAPGAQWTNRATTSR